uniref:Uncharacterized protein n=1 Tax=Siphoviridae sp. ctamP19 TaxID=2827896 RepID=A0A8S5TND1_9CAUD|nr:MAG TPA: hypothetical protein [Siphoviridae sp. ctamP19]
MLRLFAILSKATAILSETFTFLPPKNEWF